MQYAQFYLRYWENNVFNYHKTILKGHEIIRLKKQNYSYVFKIQVVDLHVKKEFMVLLDEKCWSMSIMMWNWKNTYFPTW